MEKHKRIRRPRAIRGFDEHGRFVERGKRPVMGVFRSGRAFVDPEAPHFRYVARTYALPGKHVRQEIAPLKAHSKAD